VATPTPKDNQDAYVQQRDRLLDSLTATKDILTDLRIFNKDSWVVRYPQLRPLSEEPVTQEPAKLPEQAPVSTPKRPRNLNLQIRSLSFLDDPTKQHEVVFSPTTHKSRSLTLATVADLPEKEETSEPEAVEDGPERLIPASHASDFRLLRLDLKLGTHGSSNSPAALVSQLEKTSIANLLDDRLHSSLNQLEKIKMRVEDKTSKVLVTGDLNAGKSTFVNSLLRREIMPVDQQPCTTAFCEVHDAAENGGVEEVHIVKEGVEYSAFDESTFTRASIAELDQFISDNEDEKRKVKVYLEDKNSQAESLLNNGVVDISLIDAPGLNKDTNQTTAIFSKQEEIDVIVFVVSAENHFTLSGKEFLLEASREKTYVFVVVNKYDGIRDKNKCRRLVLDQIKTLSPRTYENADELVHFVDSVHGTDKQSFADLQTSLRSFILEKRGQSKLAPAATYLGHLLSDLELLVGANAVLAQSELDRATADLARALPVLEKMKAGQGELEDGLEAIEDAGARNASARAKDMLDAALTLVGQGKSAAGSKVQMPSYPGLLGLWNYVHDVRRALLASVDAVVKQVEDETRDQTAEDVRAINKHGEAHLPIGAAPSRREFVKSAMFGRRQNTSSRGRNMHTVGLGLAGRKDLLEASMADILDAQYQFHLHFGGAEDDLDAKDRTAVDEAATLSVVSVGLGALTMVGGKAIGARSLLEGVLSLSDLWQNESARKWAAPVIGAFALGGVAYFILELPNSVPRNVGRRIRRELVRPSQKEGAEPVRGFVEVQTERVERETRKVLRLAGYDVRERFRAAFEESTKEVTDAETTRDKAEGALKGFREFEKRAGEVREKAGLA
jgi:mitofusin